MLKKLVVVLILFSLNFGYSQHSTLSIYGGYNFYNLKPDHINVFIKSENKSTYSKENGYYTGIGFKKHFKNKFFVDFRLLFYTLNYEKDYTMLNYKINLKTSGFNTPFFVGYDIYQKEESKFKLFTELGISPYLTYFSNNSTERKFNRIWLSPIVVLGGAYKFSPHLQINVNVGVTYNKYFFNLPVGASLDYVF